jgi:hypothetical protein
MNFNYTRGQLINKTKENNPEYPEPPNFFSVKQVYKVAFNHSTRFLFNLNDT